MVNYNQVLVIHYEVGATTKIILTICLETLCIFVQINWIVVSRIVKLWWQLKAVCQKLPGEVETAVP